MRVIASIADDTYVELDKLATDTELSRSWHINQAIKRYLRSLHQTEQKESK